MNTSKKYKLNKLDLEKIGKGLAVATAGAVLTYLVQIFPQVDFGLFTPIVTAVFAVFANIARKWVTSNQ